MSLISAKTVEEGAHRVYLPRYLLDVRYAQLREAGVAFIDGVDSLFLVKSKVKLINKEKCFDWVGLDGGMRPYLPGEIARIELAREFGKPYLGIRKQDDELVNIPPPCYYDGEMREGRLFYVDLVGAYHQIYSNLTLDCVWPCGVGELPLKGVAERLSSNKLARNALVGCSRVNVLNVVTSTADKLVPFKNPFYNPAIWRHIQSILHEIANQAVAHNCCYVATDGYIFDDAIDFGWFTAYLEYNLLKYRAIRGNGYINGWASYKVGEKQTKINRSNTGCLNNLISTEGTLRWWRGRRSIGPFL